MNDNTKFDTQSAIRTDEDLRSLTTSKPASFWARLLTGFLDRAITQGTLTLFLPDGTCHRSGSGAPRVAIRISSYAALRRIAFDPDLAVGEAYMDGTLEILEGDIYDFLDLCLGNLRGMSQSRIRSGWKALRRLARPLVLYNPVRRAQRTVAHHYDLSDPGGRFRLRAE